MKITIESTAKLVTIDGVATRVWQGHTENGIEMHAYVALVAVRHDSDRAEFERDLQTCAPPRAELAAIPARMIR